MTAQEKGCMLAHIQFSCKLGLAALGKALAEAAPNSKVTRDSSVAFPGDEVSPKHCLRLDLRGTLGGAEQDEIPGLPPGRELQREAADCKGQQHPSCSECLMLMLCNNPEFEL